MPRFDHPSPKMTASAVVVHQASLAALLKQDLVLKEGTQYVVVDSLLREWIARRTF